MFVAQLFKIRFNLIILDVKINFRKAHQSKAYGEIVATKQVVCPLLWGSDCGLGFIADDFQHADL